MEERQDRPRPGQNLTRRLIIRLRIVAALLATVTAVAGYAATPGAVTAAGSVTVYHDTCDSIGRGDVTLALVADDSETPTRSWTVAVRAQSTEGCSAYGYAVCAGKGTLVEGIVLGTCTGPVEGASFGPVVVCYPGPMRPMVHATAHDVPAVVYGNYGTFEGKIEADLFGSAVDEPLNLCD